MSNIGITQGGHESEGWESWPADNALFICPVCGQETDSLKQYRYIQWCVFLLAGAVYQAVTVRACPACVRAVVRRSLLINVVPANLLWLLLLLPWGLGLLAVSRRRGHSRAALRDLAREAELARAAAVPASPYAAREVITAGGAEEVSWQRVTAVLAVLLCWIPVLGVLFAVAAVFLNRAEPGWTRKASVVAAVVAVVITVGLFVALLADNLFR